MRLAIPGISDKVCAMDEQATTVLGSTIVAWLADEALRDTEPAHLYGELCQRLRGVGMPILRGHVAFRVLHPLYDASALEWTAESGVIVENFSPDQSGQDDFLRSPIGHVMTHRLPVLRRRLTGETALMDFAVLEEFRASGGTDYVVFAIAFDAAGDTGVLCSWLGDRATGFTDQEIVELQRITRELSIALKSRIEHSVAQNIAHAYLGKHAGQAVLNGLIRRGDGEKITAALWYSDLRCSTELADRLSAEAFLQLLGRYFEMTAASVLDHGGEVVSLIGDAVLGLFRIEGAPDEACGRALAAASEARRRLNASQPVANNVDVRFRHFAASRSGDLRQCRRARAIAVHAGGFGRQRSRSRSGLDQNSWAPAARHRSFCTSGCGGVAAARRASLARPGDADADPDHGAAGRDAETPRVIGVRR